MKSRTARAVVFSLLILVFLAMNWFGDHIVSRLNWPIWLDSVGTVLCACLYGPVCGAMVGVTFNLMGYIIYGYSWLYALISILIATVVGIAAKRKKLDTLLDTLTTSAFLAAVTAAAAYPINLLTSGSTGNNWGDAVIGFLEESGLPRWAGLLVGELYVELLDKLVILVALYIILRLGRFILGRSRPRKKTDDGGASPLVRTVSLLFAVTLGASACGGWISAGRAAEETDAQRINYNDYTKTIYSSSNGLPCGTSNDIVMTPDGVLWIGTYAGLFRYNGREFRRMSEFDSVRNVNCLYVDDEGRLWIGTNDNGLSIMINEQIVNIIDKEHGLPSNSVKSIIKSSDGYYYIGTTAGMQILTLNTGLLRVGTLSEVVYANHIDADRNSDNVAVVNDDGYLFLMEQGRITLSRRLIETSEIYSSCTFLPDGSLLAATSGNTVYHYPYLPEKDSFDFDHPAVIECTRLKNIKTLKQMDNGELMICADNGIAHIDITGAYELIDTGEFNNSIDNMLVDYQGNMWFTSSRQGLLRLAPSDFRNLYNADGFTLSQDELKEIVENNYADLYRTFGERESEITPEELRASADQDYEGLSSAIDGTKNKVVNTVVQWNGNYYIGTDKGIDAVDAGGRKRVTDDVTGRFSENRIRCMYVDRNNHLWICTSDKGLAELNPDRTEAWYNKNNGLFGKKSRVVMQLSDGTIAAAADDLGICFILDGEVSYPENGSNAKIKSKVLTLAELPDQTILAGTDGDGIAVLENREITRIMTAEDGLSSEVILRITPDPQQAGAAYIVTGNGLCYMEPDRTIRPLKNFPYYNNYSIWFRDENTLYVLSSTGIIVVDREELLSGKEDLAYDLLDARRGLEGSLTANSWIWFNEETKDLYLPSNRGVFVLNTAGSTVESRLYRMNLSGIRAGNTLYRAERNVVTKIPREDSRIEFLPEVINYSIRDPYIGYMLEGFDDEWTIVPQNSLSSIIYSNLPVGDYVFHLAVFDNSQENILAERTYPVSRGKEMYDNDWFIFYILSVPMFTVFWVTWLLLKRHELKVQAELAEANRQVEMGKQTVAAIARAVDAKDVRTGGHSTRVALYSGQIAKAYGLDEKQCREIEWAAQLHDIGKIAIPDKILNKDSRLTDEEYAIMKSHTTEGAKILEDFTLLDHVTEGAQFHHERPDGRGYPSGLKGEEIPLYARIIGVADAFDAMTATRVYRKQMDFGYVLGELEKGRGTQFAPEFVDILLNLIRTNVINLNELYGIKPEDSGTAAEKPAESEPGKEA